jgi:putative ABC transport system permease protein
MFTSLKNCRPIFSAMLRNKTGVLLIIAQIALTFAIIANALYVVQQRLAEANRVTGIDDAGVFAINIMSAPGKNDEFTQQELDVQTLRALPGVKAAAWMNQMPLMQSGSNSAIFIDRKSKEPNSVPATYFAGASPIDALGIKLIEGRDFEASDYITHNQELPDESQAQMQVAIVTKALAKVLYPNEKSVIGKSFYWGNNQDPKSNPIRIIGVIDALVTPWGYASWGGQNADGTQSLIFPLRGHQPSQLYAVRTDSAQRAQIMKAAEKALLALTPGRMVVANKDMDTIRDDRYKAEKTMAFVLIAVVVLLLLTTAAGIVGMASLWVNQRRKQIGVRRALGATRGNILQHFLTENFLITTIGIVVGILLTVVLNLVLVEKLEMQQLPAMYLPVGAALLWLMGLLAVYGPARRAASVSPAIATRSA